MYRVTIYNPELGPISTFVEPEPIDFHKECEILRGKPYGSFVDVQRIANNPFSDTECWRDTEYEETL